MSETGSDYDRQNWQAEQAARDDAQSDYSDKMTKARARSAANAKRKIARLHAKLTELGHISDFEDEFGESVLERLDKYGSAFHDREKGRVGDALSIAQKQVVARMNKKVKELKAKQRAGEGAGADIEPDPDADYTRTADRWKNESGKKDWRNKGGFKSKRKSSYTPRVRNIEDEFIEGEREAEKAPPRPINPPLPKLVSTADVSERLKREAPYIPKYTPQPAPKKPDTSISPKRPFLRIVPKIENPENE